MNTANTTVYLHAHEGAIRIRSGFSWPAFFFGAWWAAAHRLWFPAFPILALIELFAGFFVYRAEALGAPGLLLLASTASLIYRMVCGHYGNRWLVARLDARGYKPQAGASVEHPHARELRPLWNPETAALLSLLFTPAFGTYLHMCNWEALNEPDRARSARRWFYGAAVVTALVFAAGAVGQAPLASATTPLLGAYFLTWYFAAARAQTKYLEEHFDDDYVRRPWKQPLLWALALFVGLLVASLVVGVLTDIIVALTQEAPRGRRIR